jgi:hypothetical protein
MLGGNLRDLQEGADVSHIMTKLADYDEVTKIERG